MIRELKKRFIRIAMLAITLVMLLLSLLVNVVNFISVDGDLTDKITMIADNEGTMPTEMSMEEKQEDSKGGHDKFDIETLYATRYFVLRYTGSGELVKADLDAIASVTEEDTDTYIAIALKHGEGYGYTSGYKYEVIKNGEDRYMAIFLDCHQEMRSAVEVALLSLLAMIVCIIIVYVVVVIFSRRAVDPIVQASIRQKQFITDASHELKTPITVIVTSLKVLEMDVGENKWIDKIRKQTEKLSQLVNALVSLSRMDEDDSPLSMSEFAISQVTEEVVASFADLAKEQGHEIQAQIAPDLSYLGDETAIRQLLSILLDNALKYALPETAIGVTLQKQKKGVQLQVRNACQPIPAEELPKLFDRFYRVDKARGSKIGGFGIGLSLARSIVEGHKGAITARMEEDEIVFDIYLK